ncbi:hypothetical protein VNI00_003645 [Paramarasmius palmivorus]|uniref:Uncharacterized protein n=1 Tax=Paramarasmius palmivorus TaxID=297713 RepID=A0AAW0DUA6_9AGAR
MKLLLLGSLLSVATTLRAQVDCPTGTQPVQDKDGNWWCQTTDITCPGGASRAYFKTLETLDTVWCCPSARQLVIYDDQTKIGVCCDTGKVYVGDKPNGLCCNPGEIIQDGKCAVPPPPPPPGPGEGCPSQPNNACRLRKACGTAESNGLKYGTCYQISFPSLGNYQLGRGYNDRPNEYTQRGFVQNIPFKICKSTTDCGTGAVATADTFVIEDQIGPLDNAAGAKGWSNAADPNMVAITTTAASAGQFKGQTSCSACKCVVSLTGATQGLTLNGALSQEEVFGTGLGYRLSFRPNKGASVDLVFSEVPCKVGPILNKAAAASKTVGNIGQTIVAEPAQVPLA